MTSPADPPEAEPGLYEGIMTTRAMRRFTDEPVDEADVWAVLRAAQQGPSGGNIQPWQFVVVTDEDQRARLGDIYQQSYQRYEAAMLPTVAGHRSDADAASWDRTLAATRHLAAHLGEAPVLVLVCMADISMSLVDDEGPLDVGTPFASAYPAVQNLILAARARGLGAALTTVFRIEHDEVREVCGVPDRYQVIAMVPLGHPAGRFGRARRRGVDTVTHWNQWGERRVAPAEPTP
ncbi:MAG TPA: nitroreductase family protein [Microthrixaceae bacterium]|nr:nitroreductase family protein [Microthrixaceae bacterium]